MSSPLNTQTNKNIVRIRRTSILEEHKQLMIDRIKEFIDYCGGRQEAAFLCNESLKKKYKYERVLAQELTNSLYRKKMVPQVAIRIEKAFEGMEGFERFTKEYFCPDMNAVQFRMVLNSMKFDKI